MKKKVLSILLSLVLVLGAGFGFTGCKDLFAELDPTHKHVIASEWLTNETKHWKRCESIGCLDVFYEGKHQLEHVNAKDSTCVFSGNLEYWYCTVCDYKCSKSNGTGALDSVEIPTKGHDMLVYNCDEYTHSWVCKTCGLDEGPVAHFAMNYVTNRYEHYKICSTCGVKFDVMEHNGGECSICGYVSSYEDICSSQYGYNYLATLDYGDDLQNFYNVLDGAVKDFHIGNKNGVHVSIDGNDVYCMSKIDYVASDVTLEQAECVLTIYRYDHPLYYWLTGQALSSDSGIYPCVDTPYKDGSVRAEVNESLYSVLDTYMDAVSGISSLDVACVFHDMIIDSVDYADDTASDTAYSILGVFDGTGAVGEGYAKAFSLLLNAMGIENAYVPGTAKGVAHAWNLVRFDYRWYWYDVCWDDTPSGKIYDYMHVYSVDFTNHTPLIAGDMSDPMNFMYKLPNNNN